MQCFSFIGVLFVCPRVLAVEIGPIQINKTEHHTIPISPVLGIVAILGGGALVYFGAKADR
jgi:hypothetical protein